MATILVLNGPNLNLLGTREPALYGDTTLEEVIKSLEEQANAAGHGLGHFQTNAEHVLIDKLHQARDEKVDFIIINPAALTHTSIALRDALSAIEIPFIEIHISNIHAREEFRHFSYLSEIAQGVICGLGTLGYNLALQAAIASIQRLKSE